MDIDYVDVFFGAVIALLFAEGCAWLPRLTQHIIRFAAARLSLDLRSRLEEEWLRHVSDLPGTFSPFFAACTCLLASFRISPVKLDFPVVEAMVRQFRLLIAFFKSLFPKRAQLSGANAHNVAFSVKLAWIAALVVGVALAIGALVSAVDALKRLMPVDPLQASSPIAAHRKLPLGTKLRVTNKANGRSVVVTPNDNVEKVYKSIGPGEASYYGRELAARR